MSNSILQEKANEIDASLTDFIMNDINEKSDILRISIERAGEIFNMPDNYMNTFINNIYKKISDFKLMAFIIKK